MPNSAFNTSAIVSYVGRPWTDMKADFGAVGDGATDDSTAFTNFNAWARNQTTAVWLVIPPGTYIISGASAKKFLVGIKQVILDAYGVTLPGIQFSAAFNGSAGTGASALVNSVLAGADTITLTNPADASKFTVGSWVCLTAYDLQGKGSFPPNPMFFEYRIINSIDATTGVIVLDHELLNGYSSTYPAYDLGSATSVSQGGPATLYQMQSDWDQEITIRGLNVTQATSISNGARELTWVNCSFLVAPAPTQGRQIRFLNCHVSPATTLQMEVDKAISLLDIDGGDIRWIQDTSSSVEKQIVRNCKFRLFQGTSKHAVIESCDIWKLVIGGTQGFGYAQSLVINNCRIQQLAGPFLTHFWPATAFSNGRITWQKYNTGSVWNGQTGAGGTPLTSAVSQGIDIGGTYFLGNALPFTVTNVTDNGLMDAQLVDGVYDTTTTITSEHANFTSIDVGIVIAGVGIPTGTRIASVTNPTTAVLTKATTLAGSGNIFTLNRAQTFFDTTLPATINVPQITQSGVLGWNVDPQPCQDITVRGCTGQDLPQDLINLNTAPTAQPFGVHAKYKLIEGSWAAKSNSIIWGNITKLRINVIRSYTGTRPVLLLGFGQNGIVGLIDANGSSSSTYNPCINLAVAGERVITPNLTTGTQTGDLNMTMTGKWITGTLQRPFMKITATGVLVDLLTENQTTWPIVEIELTTNQGTITST